MMTLLPANSGRLMTDLPPFACLSDGYGCVALNWKSKVVTKDTVR